MGHSVGYRETGSQLSGFRLSVCLSVPCLLYLAAGHRPQLRRVCCCEPGGQEISIDRCTAGGLAVSSSRSEKACGSQMREVPQIVNVLGRLHRLVKI